MMSPLRLFLVLVLGSFAIAACDSDPGASLYDPDATGGPAPVIASISPDGPVLAGIDEITISGQNFSPTPSQNLVFFDDGAGEVAQGTILSASQSELRVKVPNLPNANLRVRVSVVGAQDFSNEVAFPLVPASVPFGDLDAGIREEVLSMTSDGAGGLLVSLVSNGSSAGIQRFAADGTRTPYFTSSATWSGLTTGLDGTLYGVRRLRAAFVLPEGGSQQTFAVLPNGVSLATIVAGPTGELYAAGSNSSPEAGQLYHITPGGTVTGIPFTDPVTALAVQGQTLFLAAVTPTKSWIVRYTLDAAGDPGPPELFYDLTADRGPGIAITALAVAADGTLFVGTDAPDPILEVAPDGTASTLYPGVLAPPIAGFAWGPGTTLFVAVASIAPATEGGARTPAALYRLETRRQGAP